MTRVTIDDRDLARAARVIVSWPAKVRQARDQSLMNGGDKVRTDVRRALKQITGVKRYAVITERVLSSYSAGAGTYTITVKGPGLPIKEFPVSAGAAGVTASPWGRSRTFKRSFETKSGRLLARLGKGHKPVRKLYGPNPAKEATQGVMPALFRLSVRAQIGAELAKRLVKALGGAR